jgi:hypothetical protein
MIQFSYLSYHKIAKDYIEKFYHAFVLGMLIILHLQQRIGKGIRQWPCGYSIGFKRQEHARNNHRNEKNPTIFPVERSESAKTLQYRQ